MSASGVVRQFAMLKYKSTFRFQIAGRLAVEHDPAF
jgi:hypothetical protein